MALASFAESKRQGETIFSGRTTRSNSSAVMRPSFNAAALTAPPTGVTQGDLGRNVLHEFGAWQVDLALHREFRLSDHTRLQFRAEAFNALNHPNFASPSGGSSNPQQIVLFPLLFGQSSSSLAAGLSSLRTLGQLNQLFQIGGPRSLQLALRLTF